MRSTQIEKIIRVMIRQKGKEWFYAPDFQRPNMSEDEFVGYEATARMSDLIREYPEIATWKKEGKYRYIRFRFENLREIYNSIKIPKEIKYLIDHEMRQVEGRLI